MGLFDNTDVIDDVEVPVIHIRCMACGYEGMTSEEPIIEGPGDMIDVENEPEHCPNCGVVILYEEDLGEEDVHADADSGNGNVKDSNAKKRRTGLEDFDA